MENTHARRVTQEGKKSTQRILRKRRDKKKNEMTGATIRGTTGDSWEGADGVLHGTATKPAYFGCQGRRTPTIRDLGESEGKMATGKLQERPRRGSTISQLPKERGQVTDRANEKQRLNDTATDCHGEGSLMAATGLCGGSHFPTVSTPRRKGENSEECGRFFGKHWAISKIKKNPYKKKKQKKQEEGKKSTINHLGPGGGSESTGGGESFTPCKLNLKLVRSMDPSRRKQT